VYAARKLLIASIAAALVSWLPVRAGLCQTQVDTVLVDGKILTVGDALSIAQALALQMTMVIAGPAYLTAPWTLRWKKCYTPG
jgi:hypothetical protein